MTNVRNVGQNNELLRHDPGCLPGLNLTQSRKKDFYRKQTSRQAQRNDTFQHIFTKLNTLINIVNDLSQPSCSALVVQQGAAANTLEITALEQSWGIFF